MPPKRTKEQFIKLANNVHGNKYSYDRVIYVNNRTHVEIYCPIHKIFFMKRPTDHIIKEQGCKQCSNDKKALSFSSNTDDFIDKGNAVHDYEYMYTRVDYYNNRTPVEIECLKHGSFMQTPTSHINKECGCKKCGEEKSNLAKMSNKKEFIEKSKELHGNTYIYDNVIYEGAKKPVKIICREHGEFCQKPTQHLVPHGCPLCTNKTEDKLFKWLKNKGFTVIYDKKFDWCKNETHLRFDFYIPDLNLVIELDGRQHFTQVKDWDSPEKNQKTDKYKTICANSHNISIIRIYQLDVYKNKNNWQYNLLQTIKKYKTPTNIFIGNIYKESYKLGIRHNYQHNIFIQHQPISLNAIPFICETIQTSKSKKLQKYLESNNIDGKHLEKRQEMFKLVFLLFDDDDHIKHIVKLITY